MYKNVECYYEPREILAKMSEPYVEMSPFDHGFICGLIKESNPEKLVEIGVAGGGTTAVIMKCLNTLKRETRVFSVDVCEMCYRREDKQTGWQLSEVSQYLDNYSNHTFFLGKELPYVADKIGGDVDFLILDTTHVLPGEILDFIYMLPYLKDGAIVVIHDVNLGICGTGVSICTKVLFDAVYGEKYYMYEDGLTNIAAFKVNADTRENIINVFSALMIPWSYLLKEQLLFDYRSFYVQNYSRDCINLFDKIVIEQYSKIHNKRSVVEEKKRVLEICNSDKKICLYGAGIRGNNLKQYINNMGYDVDCFVISDDFDKKKFEHLETKVLNISEFDSDDSVLLLATPAKEVKQYLFENRIAHEVFSESFFEYIRK